MSSYAGTASSDASKVPTSYKYDVDNKRFEIYSKVEGSTKPSTLLHIEGHASAHDITEALEYYANLGGQTVKATEERPWERNKVGQEMKQFQDIQEAAKARGHQVALAQNTLENHVRKFETRDLWK